MCGGSPRVPSPPPPPPPPPEPPTPVDPAVGKAREDEKNALRAKRGRQSTIMTGNLGLQGDAAIANTGSTQLSGT